MVNHPAVGNGSSGTVLVVDDEPLILFALADALTHAGFQVFQADNADQAAAFVANGPDVDLMVTDVQMPGSMDGIGLAMYARQHKPDMKIIVMSGYVRQQPPAGVADAFLAKPFTPATLISTAVALLA